MVLYFTSTVVSPPVTLFMGVDKYENEELIKWGWPEDVWFHVDKYTSAHVYLRLQPGETLDDVPACVVEEAAQLVKANSIAGNKANDVDVVYTPWGNLKKTPAMDVGQVGFHREGDVRRVRVARRNNDAVNRLTRTRREEARPDLRARREQRDRDERDALKQRRRDQQRQEREDEARRAAEAELRSYGALMKPHNMVNNKQRAHDGYDSDDFM